MRALRAGLTLALLVASGCATRHNTPAPTPPEPVTFDSCLIAHMVAVQALEEAVEGGAGDAKTLLDAVLASQGALLADERLDEGEQAQRNSLLMSSYARGADAAFAEATARGATTQELSDEALRCGREL